MAPFQFIVIAALVVIALLLGTLVGCASVLTTRVRHTNAALRRIEEAVISRIGVIASVNARTAATARSPEVSTNEGEPTRYLTIRDLKSRHEHKSTRAAYRTGKHSVPITPETQADTSQSVEVTAAQAHVGNGDEPNIESERSNAPAEQVRSADFLAANSESADESVRDDEPAGVLASHAENEILAASLERLSPTDAAEQAATAASVSTPISAASVDKKDRDALLVMLSNQRRRRRARHGY